MNVSTKRGISFIPNDDQVVNLRSEGFEVHVFQGKERRIVAVKFSTNYIVCDMDGEPICVMYDTYDSKLEAQGLFPIRILTQRDVEALRNNSTYHYEGPWIDGVTPGESNL
ncbi:MAG: hypothetical protein LBC11_01420 [Puniceicoccales bacterium]|nr:hypothetical protein [Puniceicoccales bacterium]